MTKQEILEAIEEARLAEELTNDQARAASVCLGLEGDEAMLACRLMQGADPASLDYLDTGAVSSMIQRAHRDGPAVYTRDDPELLDYLALCALSADESRESTLRTRVLGLARAMRILNESDGEFRDAALVAMGAKEMEKIEALPYKELTVHGTPMRVYNSDRGFVAAAWAGEQVAATLGSYNGEPYLAVGAPPQAPTLEEQGVPVDKTISPRFGIISEPNEVARVETAFLGATPG